MLLVLVGVLSLACGSTSGGVKLGLQKNSQQRGLSPVEKPTASSDPAPATPPPTPEPEVADTGTTPAMTAELVTSARTVEAVREQGFEPVPVDQPVAGPFDGPGATVVYVNIQGLMTYYHPQKRVAYFARADDGKIQYGISALGYYRFLQGTKAQALETAPNALLAWPMAVPVANQIAQYANDISKTQGSEATLAQQNAFEAPELFAQIKQMSQGVHVGSRQMLEGIGGPDCQKQRTAEFYLGCW